MLNVRNQKWKKGHFGSARQAIRDFRQMLVDASERSH